MQTPQPHRSDTRSLGELLTDLTQQITSLIQKEIEMARLETSRTISAMVKDAVLISVGVALLYAGLLALLATSVIILAQWISLWLAALIVSIAVLVIGGILALVGKGRMQERDITPTQTIISLKENKRWIKKRI
ncbi:MAG: phage holin family protein [Desulfosarcina sp.]